VRFTLARLKRPTERFRLGVDFAKDLEAGDSINQATVTAHDDATGADVSSTFLQGAPVVTGTLVKTTVKAGDPGRRYAVVMHVTTVALDEFEHDIVVTVRPGA